MDAVAPAVERPSTLDWNGNEAQWNNVASNNLVASIKVSPLSPALKTISTEVPWCRNNSSGNILQLDGAADSSDTEPEKSVVVKLEKLSEEEPVKCRRCRRSYRTLTSFNKHIESCVEMLSSSSGSEDESEEDIIPVQLKKEPVEPVETNPVTIPILLQPKEEPMDVVQVNEQLQVDPVQVPVVNSSSHTKSSTGSTKFAPNKSAPIQPKPNKIVKPRTPKRRFRPNVNAIPPRTLAIRQPNPPQNVRFTVPAASPIPPAYQVTLQSPPPPPLLYVTRPELNSSNSTLQCGFLSQSTVTVPQQHYIIMPPSIDQTFVQANCGVSTLSSSGLTLTQHSSSPMVQYLGAVPSNLLSALGIMTTNMGVTNYTVPSISTLLQGQSLQVPWEPPVSNQIVILPQQPLLSFNLPTSVSLQPPAQLSPTITAIEVGSAPAEEQKVVASRKEDNICKTKPASVETADKSEANSTLKNGKVATQPKLLSPQVVEDEEVVSEIPPLKSSCSVEESSLCVTISEGKPPKPTYSYRSAMGGKKTPRVIAPIEAKVEQSSIVQQLKVVAHPSTPDKATRTFHLKATTDEPEQVPIRQDEVDKMACSMTQDIPEQSDRLADISDVFATPPASSEPPILPSDIDAEPISWPVIDSTLVTEEPKPPPDNKKKEAHILYELVSDDGFYVQSDSLSTVWQKLLDAVQDARLALKMEPLYNGCLKSVNERNLHLTGLHHNVVVNLLEQLPNADHFADYTFRYRAHRERESAEKLITGSTHGCVRAAPFNGRVPYDMFGWLASQYRPRPQLSVRAAADLDGTQQPACRRVTNFELLPMTVRFKHLRQVAKNSVGVFRSHIHGRGLFCKRDIEVSFKVFLIVG